MAEDTCRGYQFYAQAFAEASGYLPAMNLPPFHVTRWVDAKAASGQWNQTTQFNARRTAFRIFSWAHQEKLLPRNPLKECQGQNLDLVSGR